MGTDTFQVASSPSQLGTFQNLPPPQDTSVWPQDLPGCQSSSVHSQDLLHLQSPSVHPQKFSILRTPQCRARADPILRAHSELLHPQNSPIHRQDISHSESIPRSFPIFRASPGASPLSEQPQSQPWGEQLWGGCARVWRPEEQQDGGKAACLALVHESSQRGRFWTGISQPGTHPWPGAHVQPPRSVTQIPLAAAHPTPAPSQAVLEAEPPAPTKEGV